MRDIWEHSACLDLNFAFHAEKLKKHFDSCLRRKNLCNNGFYSTEWSSENLHFTPNFNRRIDFHDLLLHHGLTESSNDVITHNRSDPPKFYDLRDSMAGSKMSVLDPVIKT